MFVSAVGDWCLSPETDNLRFGAGPDWGFWLGGLFLLPNAPVTALLAMGAKNR
jgi:hypothetical protein